MKTYEQMTDEQLIARLREGDSSIIDYLMDKYKNTVRKEANAMYLLGGENDDLIQEGMIGLFKAVQDYDFKQGSSFFSFAKLCITRQMYSAIEASKRKKHVPLNSYISFYEEGEDQRTLVDTMAAGGESNRLEECLSDLENRVLYLHLMGTDYKTIARLLDKSPKTVDNALQRIKNKTEKILEKEV